MDENLDIKRKSIETKAKWIIGGIAAVVVSPVIFFAVKGIIGIFLALGVGYTCTQMAPVFAMKIANWKMKLIMGEANKNPIETMLNLFAEKSQELEEARQVTIDWEAELGNFTDETKQFAKDYPDEAERYQQIRDTMAEGLKDAKQEVRQRGDDLENFGQEIKKAKAIYKMALAAAKVSRFDKSAEQKVFQDIKQQVAFDSVRTSLNRSFAQMNAVLAKRQERPALAAQTPKSLRST